MTKILEKYNEQGFLFPLHGCSGEQAAQYRAQLEAADARYGRDASFQEILHGSANFALPFVDEITRLPSVLEPVAEILGPDLLVWGAGFFTKEPDTASFVSWHQDLTYWGLSDAQEVTAWVALSEVTTASGCMQFIPGSHTDGIVPHRDTFADDNLLSRGQHLDIDPDLSQVVDIELQPGQFSLHHGRMFHASGPNTSNDRRIGLAIRYITPAMCQTSGEKPFVRLVAGQDTGGHFQLLPPTTDTMHADYLAAYHHNVRVQHQDLFAGAENKSKTLQPGAQIAKGSQETQ